MRNGRSLRSYNDLAGRNGSGHCGDATMPRDSPVGSSRRCTGREDPFSRRPKPHRIERPHALKIPARRAEYSLTENVASPFQAEPRHFLIRVPWIRLLLSISTTQNELRTRTRWHGPALRVKSNWRRNRPNKIACFCRVAQCKLRGKSFRRIRLHNPGTRSGGKFVVSRA